MPIFPWQQPHLVTTSNGALHALGDYWDSSKYCPLLFRATTRDADGNVLVGGLRSPCTQQMFYTGN